MVHGKSSNYSILNLLKDFYHVSSSKDLLVALKDDLVAEFFIGNGSGLVRGIVRSVYYRLILNYRLPSLIGANLKIINYSKVKMGKNLWVKDNVTIFAGGSLKIGNNCVLCERSIIWSGSKGVYIGDNVSVGIGSYLSALHGKIEIEDEVRIADSVRIYSWNHNYNQKGVQIAKQGFKEKNVKIGYNCWIGSGVMIVAGVNIGEGCVVAAGSVVTKSFPPHSLIAGVPAKIHGKIK